MIEGILTKYGQFGVGPPVGWSPLGVGDAAVVSQHTPVGFGQVWLNNNLFYTDCAMIGFGLHIYFNAT